jgi:signal transduction histidine kinase
MLPFLDAVPEITIMTEPARPQGRNIKLATLALLLAGLSVAHFLSPAHSMRVHDFLFKATYLPIVLAGLWFGWRGGLYTGIVTSAVYAVHIQWQLAEHAQHGMTASWLELILYFVVGMTVGLLADRDRATQVRLAQTNDELAQSLAQVREKTAALLTAEDSLHRADRLKAVGELAAGVAHEVRNPLGGILGAARILADPATEQQARAEFADVLTTETKRLDRVISNLLDLARPPSGEKTDASLLEELEVVRSLVAGHTGARTTKIETEGVDPGLRVAIASDALRQVVLNLTLNALTAIDRDPGRIVWQSQETEGVLQIRIGDNGRGIDPGIRERIFEPFVGSGSDKRATGLGLSIVSRILADAGGAIAMEQTGRDGTTFKFSLPLSQPPEIPESGDAT